MRRRNAISAVAAVVILVFIFFAPVIGVSIKSCAVVPLEHSATTSLSYFAIRFGAILSEGRYWWATGPACF